MAGLRIAVCDDEAIERFRLRRLLEKAGQQDPAFADCRVLEYSSGRELLAGYFRGSFDLVFLDICMTDVDGIEVTRKIREVDPRVPIVFLTGSSEFAMNAYSLRVSQYLVKPAKGEDVLEVLRTTLLHKSSRPALTVRAGGVPVSIPYDSILCLEQQGHQVRIRIADEEPVLTTAKLSDLALQLPEEFYACHKSYLVNLIHVRALDRDLKAYLLDDGSYVSIRRESLAEAKRKMEAQKIRPQ